MENIDQVQPTLIKWFHITTTVNSCFLPIMDTKDSPEAAQGNGSLVQDLDEAPPTQARPSVAKRPLETGEGDNVDDEGGNGAKRTKLDQESESEAPAGPDGEIDEKDNDSKPQSSVDSKPKPVATSADESQMNGSEAATLPNAFESEESLAHQRSIMENGGRWRTHQMAEDYVGAVAKLMYPGTKFGPYGYNHNMREFPLEYISVLAFIKSPLRRPTVIEKWSPYEVALFEGAMLHYGKEFHLVSREIKTKTTQEVIDFYYVWKKTAHYKKWKEQFITDEELDFRLEQASAAKR
mmetsp:Transcript_18794/g.46569  ORF Transcript_18794/g.46569 Transcript_18794/m.46569 type:complete len:294 (-) Transcript_18794:70-951(-)